MGERFDLIGEGKPFGMIVNGELVLCFKQKHGGELVGSEFVLKGLEGGALQIQRGIKIHTVKDGTTIYPIGNGRA